MTVSNIIKIFLFVALGAVGGYAYYYFIGCNVGNACPITSNPLSSAGYGALIGGVISINFLSRKKKHE